MNYLIKGNLKGYLCEDCSEAISQAEVLLYLPFSQDQVLSHVVADVKDTFRIVSEDEAAQRSKLLIAKAVTDDLGNFEISIDEKYAQSAFDIDFICASVPKIHPKAPKKKPVQVHLTTFLPEWKLSNDRGAIFFWNYEITAKWWCHIRGHYFDAWVICGKIYSCDTGAVIPGASVTAYDSDFLTDDNLGTSITDAFGHFRIDYTSYHFKKTFLSPLVNVETDPGLPLTFNSGPDVYFKVSLGGATIISEPKSSKRKNVSYCLCVDLCAKNIDPRPEPKAIPAFIRVGGIDYELQINSAVGENGKTKTSNYAFFSTLRLNGILPQRINNKALEYCFEFTNQYDSSGNPINWARVSPGMIPNTNIGYVEKSILMAPDLIHPSPWYKTTYKNCIVTNAVVGADEIQVPISADGWILVPQNNDNPLNQSGNGFFVSNGNQILLNSTLLASFAPINLSTQKAGIPAATIGTNEIFAIRMLSREQGNDATIIETGRCTRLAINNTKFTGMIHHPNWGPWGPTPEFGVNMVDIAELQTLGCAKIKNEVNILYTSAHPDLGLINLTMTGPAGTITLLDNHSPLPNSAANIKHTFAATDPDCAYLVTLKAQYLLTTGDSSLDQVMDQIAFCKQANTI